MVHVISLVSFLWLWFSFFLPSTDKDKRLMEVSWWKRGTAGKLGIVLMGRAMLSKSWIQVSVDGWGCVPFLLFDLRPNYGGGNEDNCDLLQKVLCTHCCTLCPWLCSRSLPIHASARDSWIFISKSRPHISCEVTFPFFWVLLHTRFCLCPPRVCFPSPVLSSVRPV